MGLLLDLAQSVRLLQAGEVLAYPTEGVWGLGCLPTHPDAIRRILKLKQRDPAKGLILIGAQVDDFAPYIEPLDEAQQAQLNETAHPVTWLVPAARTTSSLLCGDHDTQAVRLTRHPLCRALCEQLGALVSTSANVQGKPPARTMEEVEAMLGGAVDGILNGELGTAHGPSEIRDLNTDRVLRPSGA